MVLALLRSLGEARGSSFLPPPVAVGEATEIERVAGGGEEEAKRRRTAKVAEDALDCVPVGDTSTGGRAMGCEAVYRIRDVRATGVGEVVQVRHP